MSCCYAYLEDIDQKYCEEKLFIKFDNKEVQIIDYEITDQYSEVLRPKKNIKIRLFTDQMKMFSRYFELEDIYKDLTYHECLKSKKEKEYFYYEMSNKYGFSSINKAKRFGKEPFYSAGINKTFRIGNFDCRIKDVSFEHIIDYPNTLSNWIIYGEVIIRD